MRHIFAILTALFMLAFMLAAIPISAQAAGALAVTANDGVYTGYVTASTAPLVSVTAYEGSTAVASAVVSGDEFTIDLGYTGTDTVLVAEYADGSISVTDAAGVYTQYAESYAQSYVEPYVSSYATHYVLVAPYVSTYSYSYGGGGDYANPYYSDGGHGFHDHYTGTQHTTWCTSHPTSPHC